MQPVTPQASAPDFEVALEQLQTIVKKLEAGELSLEDSLKSFEEGVRLTRACQDFLSKAEQRIQVLTQGSSEGSPQFEPFGSSSRG